jgi:hypothetical protein
MTLCRSRLGAPHTQREGQALHAALTPPSRYAAAGRVVTELRDQPGILVLLEARYDERPPPPLLRIGRVHTTM